MKIQLKIEDVLPIGEKDEVDGSKGKTNDATKGSKNKNDDDDEDFGFDPDRYVPFEEKAEFADLMKKASKEGLTQVVEYLLHNHPEAIEDQGNNRLQIKVDQIEKAAFLICRDVLQ